MIIKPYKNIMLIVLIVVSILSACSNQPKVPHSFPKENEMAAILTDLYMAESTMNSYPMGYREGIDKKSPQYYKFVLDKHNLSKQEFDTILAWYTANPYLFTKVYERVISILGTREADFKNMLLKEDSLRKLEILQVDSIFEKSNIWSGDSLINLPKKDTISTNPGFSTELDSLKGGVLKLEARYRFRKENQISKAEMLMMVCYSDSTADTVRYELDRSFVSKINKLTIELEISKKAILVEGTLLDYDTLKKASVEIKDITLEYQPSIRPVKKMMEVLE